MWAKTIKRINSFISVGQGSFWKNILMEQATWVIGMLVHILERHQNLFRRFSSLPFGGLLQLQRGHLGVLNVSA